MNIRITRSKASCTVLCIVFALLTALFPFVRAFYRAELSYNEGWNIYNANIVANHQLLYPAKYGWTTVNYPMLSFVLFAQLHRLTHEYLFTARVVSLLSVIGCCILVGLIVRALSASAHAGWLAGFFCLALFCTNADPYVGIDDPQMLALFFFLAGFFLYLRRRDSLLAIAGAAAVFVFAGCIKHNPIDFPLAVLIDLALISWRRALWFSGWGIAFAAIAVALNIHYGGPYFLNQIFTPRGYFPLKVLTQARDFYGPLLLPLAVAIYMAYIFIRDKQKRIAALLLMTGLIVGNYFSGGQGVTINSQFTALLAIAILIGLFFSEFATGRWTWRTLPPKAVMPLLFFGWMVIPMIVNNIWNPVRDLRETAAAQQRFDQDVALLRSQNGPALCESLLRCYFAGKPYLYDPFNATSLVEFGKLDPAIPVDAIRSRQDAAIELAKPVQSEYSSERFSTSMLDTIRQNYVPILDHEDAVIYIPRAVPAHVQASHAKPDYAPDLPRHHRAKTG